MKDDTAVPTPPGDLRRAGHRRGRVCRSASTSSRWTRARSRQTGFLHELMSGAGCRRETTLGRRRAWLAIPDVLLGASLRRASP